MQELLLKGSTLCSGNEDVSGAPNPRGGWVLTPSFTNIERLFLVGNSSFVSIVNRVLLHHVLSVQKTSRHPLKIGTQLSDMCRLGPLARAQPQRQLKIGQAPPRRRQGRLSVRTLGRLFSEGSP